MQQVETNFNLVSKVNALIPQLNYIEFIIRYFCTWETQF